MLPRAALCPWERSREHLCTEKLLVSATAANLAPTLLLLFADAFGFATGRHSRNGDDKEFRKQGIFVGLKQI